MEISDGMSIEHYAMLNSNNAVLQGVGFAMLKNVMDTQEQMGAELTKMMEQSVNPSLGSNIDYRV
jgi:hypothetical protein